jgi:hypothetical protein
MHPLIIFKFWAKFEFTTDAILKILTKCNQTNSSGPKKLTPSLLIHYWTQPNSKISKFQNLVISSNMLWAESRHFQICKWPSGQLAPGIPRQPTCPRNHAILPPLFPFTLLALAWPHAEKKKPLPLSSGSPPNHSTLPYPGAPDNF